MDPELEAMGRVAAALDALDAPSQARVLRWAADRYAEDGSIFQSHDRQRPNFETGTPEDIAELFADANVRTDTDRALLAGYWFQHHLEARDWTGQQVNSELRQMGVGASNITHVLSRLIAQRPALVQQLSKSGRSKQARKQYRLTTAGLQAARALLDGEQDTEA
jgi:hypothetical protein